MDITSTEESHRKSGISTSVDPQSDALVERLASTVKHLMETIAKREFEKLIGAGQICGASEADARIHRIDVFNK